MSKHICDCGTGYSNLDALHACQASRHGAGPELDPISNAAPDMLATLGEIARGRPDCGRPLASEKARQLARGTLTAHGLSWPSRTGSAP